MGLKLNTASSGSVTIEPTNTASNYTLTAPATNATLAINGPAFSAYASSVTNLSNGTYTKVLFNTEEFDTNSNYDTATSRFTPTVTGYYQVNAAVSGNLSSGQSLITLYKNGNAFKNGTDGAYVAYRHIVSSLIYFNGTTDYVEVYAYQATGSSQNTYTGVNATYFQASMVRAA